MAPKKKKKEFLDLPIVCYSLKMFEFQWKSSLCTCPRKLQISRREKSIQLAWWPVWECKPRSQSYPLIFWWSGLVGESLYARMSPRYVSPLMHSELSRKRERRMYLAKLKIAWYGNDAWQTYHLVCRDCPRYWIKYQVLFCYCCNVYIRGT